MVYRAMSCGSLRLFTLYFFLQKVRSVFSTANSAYLELAANALNSSIMVCIERPGADIFHIITNLGV